MAKTKTHLELVSKLVQRRSGVTVADAERAGVSRLAARIFDLRNEGFPIITETKTVKGRRVTRYTYVG